MCDEKFMNDIQLIYLYYFFTNLITILVILIIGLIVFSRWVITIYSSVLNPHNRHSSYIHCEHYAEYND